MDWPANAHADLVLPNASNPFNIQCLPQISDINYHGSRSTRNLGNASLTDMNTIQRPKNAKEP